MPTINPAVISVMATAMAHPSRAAMLAALADAETLSSRDLADAAGISASTASFHLATLERSGLMTVQRRGRTTFYRLADAGVRALDALTALGPGPAPSPVPAVRSDRIARRCYDHLAGRLGVGVFDTMLRERLLIRQEWIRRPVRGTAYTSTRKGVEFIRSFGIDPSMVRAQLRSYAHVCMDRTERRPHLAGALGAACANRFLQLGWLLATETRALAVTAKGRAGFRQRFGVDI